MLQSLLRTRPLSSHALRRPPRPSLVRHHAHTRTAPVTAQTILDSYRKHSSDPVVALVHDLLRPSTDAAREQSLRASAIPPNQYRTWLPVAHAPDCPTALDRAEHILALTHANSRLRRRRLGLPYRRLFITLPPWALLALLTKQPTSQVQAYVLFRFAIVQSIPRAPDVAALILILTTHWLAQLKMYALLQIAVNRLNSYRKALHAYQIRLLLRLLAQAPPNLELQPPIERLLHLAKHTNMFLGTRTYRALLKNPATTSKVADMIEWHMSAVDFAPNLAHSRAFLSIYGRTGRVKKAATYWRRIRAGRFYGDVPHHLSSSKFQVAALEDTVKAYRRADDVHSYVRRLANDSARAQEENALAEVRGGLPLKLALPRPGHLPPNIWLRVLSAVARDPDMPIPRILELLDQGRALIRRPATSLVAITIVLGTLIRRHALNEAAPLLEEMLRQKHLWDIAQLTVAVQALTLLRRPDTAFHLLLEHAAPEGSSSTKDKAAVDTQAVNAFMGALLHIGRPDAVFYLWDTMPRVFGVEPTAVSFATLLKAAHVARKWEGALQVLLQDFGLRRILPEGMAADVYERAPQNLDRETAVEGMERLLGRKTVTGFWRGQRAGVVALRLAWQIFTGSWPALKAIRSPVVPVRSTADAQALSPLTDLYRSMYGAPEAAFSAAAGHESLPVDEGGRTYFGIVPDDATFRALLDVLAVEDRAGQVGTVLAWMRALHVQPSKATLAIALVYWAEVTLRGPLFEQFRDIKKSEYSRLQLWAQDWVGEEGMPGREERQWALKRLRRFRSMRVMTDEEGQEVLEEMTMQRETGVGG